MDQVERAQWQKFQDSAIGQLWQWLVGGLPEHLYFGLTAGVITDYIRLLTEVVNVGAHEEDLLSLREQLKNRLVQEAAGRRGIGAR